MTLLIGGNYPMRITFNGSSVSRVVYQGTQVWPDVYYVYFNTNGGGSNWYQSVNRGETASRPSNPSRTGYTFLGWYTSASGGSVYSFSSGVYGDFTLYAHWQVITYTVTFYSNGGSSVAKQTVNYGGKAAKPTAPTRTGYDFVNWYTTSALTTIYNFSSTVTSNLSLYAKWQAKTYTVTFNGNGSGSNSTKTVTYGSTVSAPSSPSRTGYTFKGWYTDSAGTTAYDFSTAVTGNLTLYAKWAAQCKISYNGQFSCYVDAGSTYTVTQGKPSKKLAVKVIFTLVYTSQYTRDGTDWKVFELYASGAGWFLDSTYTATSIIYNSGNQITVNRDLNFKPAYHGFEQYWVCPSVPTVTGHTFKGWSTPGGWREAGEEDGYGMTGVKATTGSTVYVYCYAKYDNET